jgi:hypothetical protein
MMNPLDYKELLVRELDNLHKEISSIDESKLWTIAGDVKNSPGNLCLHLLGNVNHFIGATISKNGYMRRRDDEFALTNIPKEKLLEDILAAKEVVSKVFENMAPETLEDDFPYELFGKRSTAYMLTYFIGHFMYHLGQINYYRRLNN